MNIEQKIDKEVGFYFAQTGRPAVQLNWEPLNKFPEAASYRRVEVAEAIETEIKRGSHEETLLAIFEIIDRTIDQANDIECLLSDRAYIRNTKQWLLENKKVAV